MANKAIDLVEQQLKKLYPNNYRSKIRQAEQMRQYWIDREMEHMKQLTKFEQSAGIEIERYYNQAIKETTDNIENFYQKYATKNGISSEEAMKKITQFDVEAYKKEVADVLKLPPNQLSRKAKDQLEMYNMTMKVNRQELLNKRLQINQMKLHGKSEAYIEKQMNEAGVLEYERQAGILGETVSKNVGKHVEAIVNSSFLSAKWDDRLWTNQTALRTEIEKLLQQGITQGLSSGALASQIRDKFEVSMYEAQRLLVTEMARARADIFEDSMERQNFDQYEYIAEPTACNICSALDGEVFYVEDMEIGVNMYPMHPNCKCATAAFVDGDAFEKALAEFEAQRDGGLERTETEANFLAGMDKESLDKYMSEDGTWQDYKDYVEGSHNTFQIPHNIDWGNKQYGKGFSVGGYASADPGFFQWTDGNGNVTNQKGLIHQMMGLDNRGKRTKREQMSLFHHEFFHANRHKIPQGNAWTELDFPTQQGWEETFTNLATHRMDYLMTGEHGINEVPTYVRQVTINSAKLKQLPEFSKYKTRTEMGQKAMDYRFSSDPSKLQSDFIELQDKFGYHNTSGSHEFIQNYIVDNGYQQIALDRREELVDLLSNSQYSRAFKSKSQADRAVTSFGESNKPHPRRQATYEVLSLLMQMEDVGIK